MGKMKQPIFFLITAKQMFGNTMNSFHHGEIVIGIFSTPIKRIQHD